MSFARLALAAALVAASPSVFAATDSKTMDVKVTVTNVCTLTTAALNFNSADLSADADGQTDVTVKCSNKGAYSLAFGTGGSGGAQRQMKHTDTSITDTLNYDLYSDSGRSTALTDTSFKGTSKGGNLADTHTVYGRVPSGQSNKATGNYSDSVQVTLTF